VGKPAIFVNQYDNPIDVYSNETIDEMKDERVSITNPEAAERVLEFKKSQKSDNPLAAQAARKFDPAKSNVIGLIGKGESRGQ
jgi:hypothetical protein